MIKQIFFCLIIAPIKNDSHLVKWDDRIIMTISQKATLQYIALLQNQLYYFQLVHKYTKESLGGLIITSISS